MVVKMMRWPPWPPLLSRKFEVNVTIQRLQGLNLVQFDAENNNNNEDNDDLKKKRRLVVEIKWKGQKSIELGTLRRSVKRNFTEEGGFCGNGVFEWNKEFKSVCTFSGNKEGIFHPWEVAFTVFSGLNQESTKSVLVGTATLNLAEFASTANKKELEIILPLVVPRKTTDTKLLVLSLSLMELETNQELSQAVPRLMQPIPPSPSSEEALSARKDELSGLKSGLRKVRIFGGTKKVFHEEESSDIKHCVRRDNADYNYAFDSYSLNNDAEAELEENDGNTSSQLSINYETLASANFAGGSFYSSKGIEAQDEGWIYYNNHKQDKATFHVGHSTATAYDQSLYQSSKRFFLPWKKRKLIFRSRKPKVKGEPLLKKDYGEGGDDIDFDRRQLISSDDSSLGWNKSEEGSTTSRSSFSAFGDDHFVVGSWEQKEVINRDGHMKVQTQVFFASIDQRSEQAAGESACTALVAVIAHWLQSNRYEVPIKSEFDSLIRYGSLAWRILWENQDYRQQFPDKHFDLDTVLRAKIRPLSVVAEKSFIGFFLPEGLKGGDFNSIHGAMSFDSIWEEIGHTGSDLSDNDDPLVYVVSWNDHFFILKVEQDAYYIIDTLGERLFEGCNQAYVLKFDKDAIIKRLPAETKVMDKKYTGDKMQLSKSKEKSSTDGTLQLQLSMKEAGKSDLEEEIFCRGKDCCKEYIKSFLAAIPIRELQADIKKGLMVSTPIHHRLQIEFHCTQLIESAVEYSSSDGLPLAVVT